MIYGLLGIVIIILIILLFKKHYTDFTEETKERDKLKREVDKLKLEKEQLDDGLDQCEEAVKRAYARYQDVLGQYNEDAAKRKETLENDYQTLLAAKRELYARECNDLEEEIYAEWSEMLNRHTQNCINLENTEKEISLMVRGKQIDYENLIAPFKLLEKEQQEKIFYCIQINDLDKEDIHYLLAVVAPQVRNKDIIPKLVWSEYIQKPVQDLMKRVEIEDKPGIYKITNIGTNKCYVGKSTKVRGRLIDHIKSAIGISTIADQRIHHAILDEGLWNWTFEKICECSKEELSDKEKYYIAFFKAQEWGYNMTSGG